LVLVLVCFRLIFGWFWFLDMVLVLVLAFFFEFEFEIESGLMLQVFGHDEIYVLDKGFSRDLYQDCTDITESGPLVINTETTV
jgi:hypothetical protein